MRPAEHTAEVEDADPGERAPAGRMDECFGHDATVLEPPTYHQHVARTIELDDVDIPAP